MFGAVDVDCLVGGHEILFPFRSVDIRNRVKHSDGEFRHMGGPLCDKSFTHGVGRRDICFDVLDFALKDKRLCRRPEIKQANCFGVLAWISSSGISDCSNQ